MPRDVAECGGVETERAVCPRLQAVARLSLLLPVVILLSYSTLVFLSLISSPLSGAIKADKLALVLTLSSPGLYVVGLILAIISLFKSEMRLTAYVAAAVNVTMLALFLCFGQSFLTELSFAGLG